MRTIAYSDTAILTADGCMAVIGELTSESCCPIEPCQIDPCSLMCNFIGLLPNGPLWDRAKTERMARYQQEPCGPACMPTITGCASVVDYAIYSGYQLDNLIKGPLWSALREANPATAVETLDSWLQMYGWTDSWESLCRDKRLGPSPFECTVVDPELATCDSSFSPIYVPPLPPALDNAVKRGIVLSLTRLRMQPIKNLCGINWIIEPLGAILRPSAAATDTCCNGMVWELCSISDTIEAVPAKHCVESQEIKLIPAFITIPSLVFNPATGTCEPTGTETIRIWPGILAAQIIALSLMPLRNCSPPIVRCPELGDTPSSARGDFRTGVFFQNGSAVPAATAWSFARNSIGRYFDAAGAYQTAAIDVARIDHDPNNANAPLGIMIERTRTNLIRQSTQLGSAPWSVLPGGGQSVVLGDASIFGGNLWTLTSVFAGASDTRQNNAVPADSQIAVSFVAKRGNVPVGRVQMHILGGVGGTAMGGVDYNFDTDTLTPTQFGPSTVSDLKRTIYSTGEVLLEFVMQWTGGGTGAFLLLNGRTAAGESTQYGHIQVEVASLIPPTASSRVVTGAAQETRFRDELTLHATGTNDWTITLADGTTKVVPNVVGDLLVTSGVVDGKTPIRSYVATTADPTP